MCSLLELQIYFRLNITQHIAIIGYMLANN